MLLGSCRCLGTNTAAGQQGTVAAAHPSQMACFHVQASMREDDCCSAFSVSAINAALYCQVGLPHSAGVGLLITPSLLNVASELRLVSLDPRE